MLSLRLFLIYVKITVLYVSLNKYSNPGAKGYSTIDLVRPIYS